MPINLLAFPSLVQEEIYRNMGYSQLFLLSLCSLRVRHSIRLVRFNIPKLRYVAMDKKFDTQIVFDDNKPVTIITLKEGELLNEKKAKMGIYVRFQISSDCTSQFPNTMLVSRIDNELQILLQDNINYLFRYSGTNHYAEKRENCLSTLPGIRNISNSTITGCPVQASTLEEYFLTNPNHRSAYLGSITGVLNETPVLYSIESIFLEYQYSSVFLDKFTGRHLYLRGANLEISDIQRFYSKWISGEAYHNLETFVANGCQLANVNVSMIEEFGMERYDPIVPERFPENFRYDPKIMCYLSRNVRLRTHAFAKVRRRSDGRIAYTTCGTTSFQFYVTDEQ